MSNTKQKETKNKPEWEAPKLVRLDFGLDDIENGLAIGNDGDGGLTTSLS